MRLREIATVMLAGAVLGGWAGAGRIIGDLQPDPEALARPEAPTTRPTTMPSTMPATQPAQVPGELLPKWVGELDVNAQ